MKIGLSLSLTAPRGVPSLRAVLDAQEPIGAIPATVVVRKTRSDYPEPAVYTPLESTGQQWARWHLSNRLNPGAAGGLEVNQVTLAKLSATTALGPLGTNSATGYTAATPTGTTAAASTTTGTWTGPTTVSSVTNVYYSTTTGDAKTYRVTVPEGGRIVAETVTNASNGAVVKVTITAAAGGAEIAAGNYTCPLSGLDRLVNLLQPNSTWHFVPLAKNLPAGDYDVKWERHSSSVATGRSYIKQVHAYAAIAYNAAGAHGTIHAVTQASVVTDACYFPGSVLVRECVDCTQVNFRHYETTNAASVAFKLYDSAGVEIGAYEASSLDMSDDTTGYYSTCVARGLTKGTYWLHVELLPDLGAGGTVYRVYTPGLHVFDETTPGTPGVDVFDDLDMGPTPTGGNTGTHMLMGPGNLVYATEWDTPGGDMSGDGGADAFTTGVHREESSVAVADLAVTVDGSAVGWSAAAAGTDFQGAEVVLGFSTTVYDPGSVNGIATLARTLAFSRGGVMEAETTLTMTAAARRGNDYIAMLQAPNGGDTRADGLGGGFTTWATDQSRGHNLGASDGSSTDVASPCSLLAAAGPNYALYVELENPSEILSANAAYDADRCHVLFRDNTTHTAKGYIRSTQLQAEIASGASFTVRKRYRVIPTTNGQSILA